MAEHIAVVRLPMAEFKRVNRLLRLSHLDKMSDTDLRAVGACTKDNTDIFVAEFDDGSKFVYTLRSDEEYYWDEQLWQSADGEDEAWFDSEYELETENAYEVDGEEYIVRLELY